MKNSSFEKNKSRKKFYGLICFNICYVILFSIIYILAGYKSNLIPLHVVAILPLFILILLIVNIASSFIFWKVFRFKSLIPLVIILLSIVLVRPAIAMGKNISLYIFTNRLPEYEAAVKMMENNYSGEPISFWKEAIPEQFRHLGFQIRAQKYDPDILTVEFYWEYFPIVGDSAYIYRPDGKIPENNNEFMRKWLRLDRINEHWFKGYDDI